jgi:hypothetical protein
LGNFLFPENGNFEFFHFDKIYLKRKLLVRVGQAQPETCFNVGSSSFSGCHCQFDTIGAEQL